MCDFTLTEIHYDRPAGGFSKHHPDEAYTVKVGTAFVEYSIGVKATKFL
jgi:hypothetical protein